MSNELNKMMEIADNPYAWLKKLKADEKRKVIGVFPMHVPDEVIHAAGMVPVTIFRTFDRITLSPQWLPSAVCDYSRSCADLALNGVLDVTDGLVVPNTCYTLQYLFENLKYRDPKRFVGLFYNTPLLSYKTTQDYYRKSLKDFIDSMGELSGQKITADSFRKTAEIYNENRRMLRALYDLRRERPGLFKAKEILAIVASSMLMPKEDHNKLLKPLLHQAETSTRGKTKKGVRILLSGSMCEAPDPSILDEIEAAGGVIVDDDLYVGSRSFVGDLPLKGDYVEALANRYFSLSSFHPVLFNPDINVGEMLLEKMKKARAEALIVLLVMHCEGHWLTYSRVKKVFDPLGVPLMVLEMEVESLSLARVRNRLDIFMHIAKQKAALVA